MVQKLDLSAIALGSDGVIIVNLAVSAWAPPGTNAGGNAVAVLSRPGLSQILSVYVDNTRGLSPVRVMFPDTGFSVAVPPLTGQWANVLTNGVLAEIDVDTAAIKPTVYFCNVNVDPVSFTVPRPLKQRVRLADLDASQSGGVCRVQANGGGAGIVYTFAASANPQGGSGIAGPNIEVFWGGTRLYSKLIMTCLQTADGAQASGSYVARGDVNLDLTAGWSQSANVGAVSTDVSAVFDHVLPRLAFWSSGNTSPSGTSWSNAWGTGNGIAPTVRSTLWTIDAIAEIYA